MKFVLFFILGLCALTIASASDEFLEQEDQTFDSTGDKIIETIENIIKSLQGRFDGIMEKIDKVIQWIDNQIELMVKRAHEKAEGVKVEIVKKINEIQQKGGKAADCAKNLRKEYVRVEFDFTSDIQKCAEGVYVASEEMKKNVKMVTADFLKEIQKFRELMKECINWNPLGAIKCVRDKAGEFKKALSSVFAALSGSIKVAEVKAIELMNSAHECDMKAFTKAKDRVEKLNEKLSQCAQIQFF